MALQILISVLLTRGNYAVMMQYIVSKQNLIMIMLLLRDTSPHITLDAFHVLKIFVANPQKPPDIIKILTDNKVKLCKYLDGLHKDRESSDVQFRDEKALVIQTLEEL
jgi:calcium binding protein 39